MDAGLRRRLRYKCAGLFAEGAHDRIGSQDERFKTVYDSFRLAFETASDGGAVLFI